MGYVEDLVEKIKDSEKWPAFDRPDFLEELDNLAAEALNKDTIEGYLAALLIYHQLCEEMVKLLVKDCHFFIQLSVAPNELLFPEKKKAMFGQVLEELKSTIAFEEKDEFIQKCEQLNTLRIDIVHKLTKQSSLTTIKRKLLKVKELYDEIYEIFDAAHDMWRVAFKDMKKDRDWDDLLEE